MRRYIASILILLISLIAGYHILWIWRGISLYQTNPTRENLLKATHAFPSNPDPFYRLGLIHQWDIRHLDLKESLHHLRKAIERNPLEQDYWLNLAKVFQRKGEDQASERALENAIRIFPAGYQGRWVAGNLFLQRGEFEKALPHFSYLLMNYPNQSHVIYEVLGRSLNDPDVMLERMVPRNSISFKQYLSYLYEIGDQRSAQKAWERRDLFAYRPSREETLRHIEFLIARGEVNEAFLVWKARLQEEGLPASSDRNLIQNSGFEKEKILGGGFDWRIAKSLGAEITFDSSEFFEGHRSLRIIFSGKENVDFHHIYQYVSLKPNTDYLLKARMKTKAITTQSGLKIEILGVGPSFYKASEALKGDHDWKELTLIFRTPPQTQGAMVRVRRERSTKFDRFISGTVWIDHFSLEERSGGR